MKAVRVTYSDGSVITTSINGTDADIKRYFSIGRVFNIGAGEHDKLVKVKSIKILKDKKVKR